MHCTIDVVSRVYIYMCTMTMEVFMVAMVTQLSSGYQLFTIHGFALHLDSFSLGPFGESC